MVDSNNLAPPSVLLTFTLYLRVQGFNDYLDSGWVQSTGWLARVFLEGVSPVKTEDPWGFQIKQALLAHK